MKIIFMGTPEFAVKPLIALINKHEVLAVVTQPDRPKGRGEKMAFSPVKECAIKNQIPVLQPEKAKRKSFIEELKAYCADIYVVAAYGQILSEPLLNSVKYGAVNIHASLLPKYRGASPIHQAIIDGESVTGVTIMQMDKGLDTGDIILKKEIAIDPCETVGTLHDKLALLGAEGIMSALDLIESGQAEFTKQGDEFSYAPMLKKEIGFINWDNSSKNIINLIRGLNPWPSAYTFIESDSVKSIKSIKSIKTEQMLKIWKAEIYNGTVAKGEAGEILHVDYANGIVVGTSDGAILITEIQASGGKRMKSADFLRGNSIPVGTKFRQNA